MSDPLKTNKSNIESALLPGYLQTQYTKSQYNNNNQSQNNANKNNQDKPLSQKQKFAMKKSQISYEMPEYFTSASDRQQQSLISPLTFNKPNFDNIQYMSPQKAKLQKAKKQIGSIGHTEEFKLGESKQSQQNQSQQQQKPIKVKNSVLNKEIEVLPPPIRVKETSACSKKFQEIQNSDLGSNFFHKLNGPFSNQSDNVLSQQSNFDRDLRYRQSIKTLNNSPRKSSKQADILDNLDSQDQLLEKSNLRKSAVQTGRTPKNSMFNNGNIQNGKQRQFNSISHMNRSTQFKNNLGISGQMLQSNNLNGKNNFYKNIKELDSDSQIQSTNRLSTLNNEIHIQDDDLSVYNNNNEYSYRNLPALQQQYILLSPQQEKKLEKFFDDEKSGYLNDIQHNIDKDLIHLTLNNRKQLKQKQTQVPKQLQSQNMAQQKSYPLVQFSQLNTSRNSKGQLQSQKEKENQDKSSSQNLDNFENNQQQKYYQQLQQQDKYNLESQQSLFDTRYSTLFQDLARSTLTTNQNSMAASQNKIQLQNQHQNHGQKYFQSNQINKNNPSNFNNTTQKKNGNQTLNESNLQQLQQNNHPDLNKQKDQIQHQYKQRVKSGNFSRFNHSTSIEQFAHKYKVNLQPDQQQNVDKQSQITSEQSMLKI